MLSKLWIRVRLRRALAARSRQWYDQSRSYCSGSSRSPQRSIIAWSEARVGLMILLTASRRGGDRRIKDTDLRPVLAVLVDELDMARGVLIRVVRLARVEDDMERDVEVPVVDR